MDDRGTAVMTQMGPGRIKRYKKRSRCFVVNLDWKMSNGKPVKAYLQPNDIVMLEVREADVHTTRNNIILTGEGGACWWVFFLVIFTCVSFLVLFLVSLLYQVAVRRRLRPWRL